MKRCLIRKSSILATQMFAPAFAWPDLANPLRSVGAVKRQRAHSDGPKFSVALTKHSPTRNDLSAAERARFECANGVIQVVNALVMTKQVRQRCEACDGSRGHSLYARLWQAFWSKPRARRPTVERQGAFLTPSINERFCSPTERKA